MTGKERRGGKDLCAQGGLGQRWKGKISSVKKLTTSGGKKKKAPNFDNWVFFRGERKDQHGGRKSASGKTKKNEPRKKVRLSCPVHKEIYGINNGQQDKGKKNWTDKNCAWGKKKKRKIGGGGKFCPRRGRHQRPEESNREKRRHPTTVAYLSKEGGGTRRRLEGNDGGRGDSPFWFTHSGSTAAVGGTEKNCPRGTPGEEREKNTTEEEQKRKGKKGGEGGETVLADTPLQTWFSAHLLVNKNEGSHITARQKKRGTQRQKSAND